MTKKLTQQEFINRARQVHGNKYDYTKSVYVNARTPLLIKCNACGNLFLQRPHQHLQGNGCKKCAVHLPKIGNRKKTHDNGVLDIPFSCSKDEITSKAYKIYGAMFNRCNSVIGQKHEPAYHDCTICDEWHYFSNFLKWFKENYVEGYALDKDILIKGNKAYSPDTCCFVPIEINSLLTNRKNHRRGLIGTSKTKNGTYQAHCNIYGKIVHLGTYKTEKEAFEKYKKTKENHIKEIATKYYNEGRINKKVYNALLNYKIEIND